MNVWDESERVVPERGAGIASLKKKSPHPSGMSEMTPAKQSHMKGTAGELRVTAGQGLTEEDAKQNEPARSTSS